MRIVVELPEDQGKAIAALCAAKGISHAEAIRRAVSRWLAEERYAGREKTFGTWKGKQIDAAATVLRLRDEWEP
jgi:hypothetical protein